MNVNICLFNCHASSQFIQIKSFTSLPAKTLNASLRRDLSGSGGFFLLLLKTLYLRIKMNQTRRDFLQCPLLRFFKSWDKDDISRLTDGEERNRDSG